MQLDRQPVFVRGAHFFRKGEDDMWAFGIDPNNSLGPRKATEKDKRDYPAEWASYYKGDDTAVVAPAPKRRGRPPKKVEE